MTCAIQTDNSLPSTVNGLWNYPNDLAGIYLETLKHCLCDSLHLDRTGFQPVIPGRSWTPKQMVLRCALSVLKRYRVGLYRDLASDDPAETMRARENGADWPSFADTMIGLKRMDNLRNCIVDVLRNNVPGDLIETGAWRGGASIYMRAVLKAFDVTDRRVWVADSFAGLPKPNDVLYPADAGDKHHQADTLAIGLEQVRANFEKYGLLDDQVRFLKGWFKDTLPKAPIVTLAVMRLDGDMYESTMDGFRNLYHKLSPGGYCIVDDYGAVPGCKTATDDFRAQNDIDEPITQIDWAGVFWQKRA